MFFLRFHWYWFPVRSPGESGSDCKDGRYDCNRMHDGRGQSISEKGT